MFSLKAGLGGSRSYAGNDLGPVDEEWAKATGRGRTGEWPGWRPWCDAPK